MPFNVTAHLERSEIGCEISGIGEVKLRKVTMRAEREALVFAEEDGVRASERYMCHMISSMVHSPRMTADEIMSLGQASLEELAVCAASQLGFRKEFDATEIAMPLGVRFALAEVRWRQVEWQRVHERIVPNIFDTLESIYGASSLSAIGNLTSRMAEIQLLPQGFDTMMKMQQRLELDLVQKHLLDVASYASQEIADFTKIAGVSSDYLASLADHSLPEMQIPEPFFSDALIASGLNSPRLYPESYALPQVELMESPEDLARRAAKAERARMDEAYAAQRKLESGLRGLIAAKLEASVGPKWWKQRVPNTVKTDCEARMKRVGRRADRFHPIHYTFLGDLQVIIDQNNNWNEVFEAVFGDRKVVIGMFAMIIPLRNEIDHIRPISQREFQNFIFAAGWFEDFTSEFEPSAFDIQG